MYQYLQGFLVQITPTYLVVETGGIGYQIMAANPFRWQDTLNKEIKVFLELVVREDAMILYGFKDQNEKDLFLLLNKVSGIGPKSALSILALDDHQGLLDAIDAGNSTYLMKFPGVGKKTAQQMILDLQGKIQAVSPGQGTSGQGSGATKASTSKDDQVLEEVVAALEGLGYSNREIERIKPILAKEKLTSTQAGLSQAFKLLIK